MKLRQPIFNKLTSATGWAFFALGLFLFVSRLDNLSTQFSDFTTQFGADSIGLLPAFGLASLQITHVLLYDHATLFSVAAHFLLSCWPLLLLLTGAVMMYSSSARPAAIEFHLTQGDR